MKKRISVRGIIIEEDSIYLMFRRVRTEDGTFKEYYTTPGGGLEKNESLEETLLRELKEEFSVDVKIIEYLGKEEDYKSESEYFSCEIINGKPCLSGEELERCTEDNYYEVRKIKISDIKKFTVYSKEFIMKAYNKKN